MRSTRKQISGRLPQAFLGILAVTTAAGGPTAPAAAQEPPPVLAQAARILPRVFLDCQGRLPCDRDHIYREIRFVNWVNVREASDVHVIATSEDVGGGGQRITLDFIGRNALEALSDELTYTSSGTDVFSETRDGMTRTLSVGLLRYAAENGLASAFEIEYEDAGEADGTQSGDLGSGAGQVVRDPWNYWTFEVDVSGDLELRETSTDIEFNPGFAAERITEDWKVGFSADLRAERSRQELTGGREVRDDRNEWELETELVRSISNHLSVGFVSDGGSSVSRNQDARIAIAPAVEYNYFPYSMSNRRQLTVQYAGGVQYSDYTEETIFNQNDELLMRHQLSARYSGREEWGNATIGVNYSQFLHDEGLYRAGVNGNLSFRVTRGLDLELSANASWVQDEIYFPLSAISDEDILLGRLDLPSSYDYGARIGLGFRFGSAFTNIVNTRFSGGGGGWGGGGGDWDD